MSMRTKVLKEKVKKQEEQLSTEIRSPLVAGTALSVASKSLQEANKSLAGERGYTQLKDLQKLLRVRQQYMESQVSLLYPVKVVVGHASEQELESFTCSILISKLLYICLTFYRTDVLCRFVCVCAHNL